MPERKKIVYISALTPYGRLESFVLQEACCVKDLHHDFLIVPRNPPREIFHRQGRELEPNAIQLPLLNAAMAFRFARSLFDAPVREAAAGIVRHSRSWAVLLKNLSVLPKAVYVACLLKEDNIGHIHAHWGGTTATMAYVIHRLLDVPYSFTLHRWDIYENNMLQEKVRTADFARCISHKGKRDAVAIIGRELEEKVRVVYMGVHLPEAGTYEKPEGTFVILTPANLLPVKGHRYLIEACQRLKAKGLDFKCWIAGDGPLEEELKNMVKTKGLQNQVLFLGRLPHERVLQMYKDNVVAAVVLPSIDLDKGEAEGIPVALMEAMSYGIAVVSTDTGAVGELIKDGSGIMVSEKRADLLADAVEKLIRNRQYYLQLGRKAKEQVEKEFDILKSASSLVDLMGVRS